jgi:beta-glucosidase
MKNTGRPYQEGDFFTTKYLDSPNDPLYPFGYGLSYTTFEYQDLKLSSDEMTRADTITATITVTNTGTYTGDEVVQLYLRDLVGSVTRPVKELKGYQKITLDPGTSTTLRFDIHEEMLKFYTREKVWASEPGRFKVYIGTSSAETLESEFELID